MFLTAAKQSSANSFLWRLNLNTTKFAGPHTCIKKKKKNGTDFVGVDFAHGALAVWLRTKQ